MLRFTKAAASLILAGSLIVGGAYTSAEPAAIDKPDLSEHIEAVNPEYIPPEPAKVESVKLGNFTLTAYCSCSSCCGKSDGITATGTRATAGRTIAVDPSVISYGSKVQINGHTYIAEDCGGAIGGNRIDIYFDSHNDALAFGVQRADVYILN